MRRIAASLALVLLVSVVWASTAGAADKRALSLSASKFGFAAEPGQKGTGEVFVINEGTEPISVRIYAANQVIAEDGSATYVVPDLNVNRLSSPASWVTYKLPPDAKSVANIPYINIEPNERVPVPFTVTVPEQATPGDRQAVLFFEMFSPSEAEGGTTRVNARLGARIKTRVKGEVVEKVTIQPFTMPAWVVGSLPAYAFTMRNEGNVDEQIGARMVVLDRSGNELSSSQVVTDTPLYASTSREQSGELQLPGLPLGPQRIRLIVSYVGDSGLDKSVEEDRTVWAVPMWLLVAGAVLLVVLLVMVVWSASRRTTQRKMRGESPPPISASAFSGDEFHDLDAG
jgi:hypothetical protein